MNDVELNWFVKLFISRLILISTQKSLCVNQQKNQKLILKFWRASVDDFSIKC